MTTAYTSLLGLALPVQGELTGSWGNVVNDSITSLLDTAVAGTTTLSTDADVTLTTTTGASNQARQAILACTGARTAQRTVTAPAASKAYIVVNDTTGGYAVKIVGVGPTTGVTIANGERCLIAWNGSDFVKVAVQSGSGAFTTLSASGQITSTVSTGTAPLVIASTTKVANLNVDLLDGTDWTAPGPIGGTTPSTGAFTTLSTTGAATLNSGTVGGSNIVSESGTQTLTNKTLTSPTISGGTINNAAIGGTTPAAGAFTTLSATGATTSGGRLQVTSAGSNPASGAGAEIYGGSNPQIVGFDRGGAAYLPMIVGGSQVDIAASGVVKGSFSSTGLAVSGSTSVTNLLTVGYSYTSPVGSELIGYQATTAGNTYMLARNISASASAYAGYVLNAYGNSWGVRMGSSAANSNALEFVLDVLGTPAVKGTWSSTGLAVTGALSATGLVITSSNGMVVASSTNTSSQYYKATNASGDLYIATDSSSGNSFAAGGSAYAANYYLSYSAPHIWSIAGTEKMRLDASGNLGLGVTPSAWLASSKAFQFGSTGSLFNYSAANRLGENVYYDAGGTPTYLANGYAELYLQNGGAHTWYTAPSGTAGATATFTQRMQLDSTGLAVTGNLSATVTSGNPTLTLSGSGSYSSVISLGAGGGGSGAIYTSGAFPLQLGTNSTIQATLDTSGNLGLGVTPSAWNSGIKAVDIGSRGAMGSGAGSDAVVWGNVFYNTSSQFVYKNNGAATYYEQYSGGHYWFTAPSGTAGNAVTFTQAMTLDASGNLAVGTTSAATYRARIYGGNGKTLLLDNDASQYTELWFANNGTTKSVLGLNSVSGDFAVLNTTATGSLILGTNGTERARIDSSGNLGLGVTPSAWDSGQKVLQVSESSFYGFTGGTVVGQNAYYNGGFKYINTAAASYYQQLGASHQWYTAPSGTSGNAITWTTAMTLDASSNLAVAGNITMGGVDVGYKNIPQNSQSTAYTLVLSDAGKHILHPSADTTARTFTIPANSSVAFPIGTAVTFVNQNGAGTVTISINTDTMRLAGAGTTGSRTLAANGVATAIKLTATEWIISGTGLT